MDGEWTLIEYRPGRYAKVSPDGRFLEMATEEETRAWFAARMRLDRSPPPPRSEPVHETAEGPAAAPQLEALPVRAEAPPPELEPEPLQDEVDLLEPQLEPPYESPSLDAIDRLLREAEAALTEPGLAPTQATMPARHLAPTGEPLDLDSVTERPVRTTPVSPPRFLEPELPHLTPELEAVEETEQEPEPTASPAEPEPESFPDKAGLGAMEPATLALPLGLEFTAEIEAQPEPETLPLPLELGAGEELEDEPEPTAPPPPAEAVPEPMAGEDELATEEDLTAVPVLLLDEDEQEVEEAFEADSELQADEDRLEAEQDLRLDTEPLADEDELEDDEDVELDAELLLDEDELEDEGDSESDLELLLDEEELEDEEDSELDLELLLDEDELEDEEDSELDLELLLDEEELEYEEDSELDLELLLDEDELEDQEDSEPLYRPSGRGVRSASGIKGKPSPTDPLTFDEEEDLALDPGPEDRWLWVDPRTESGYDPLTFDQKAFLQRAVVLYQAKSWSRGHSPGRLMIHPALLANGVEEIGEALGMTVLTDPAVTPGTYRLGRAEEQDGQPTSS